MTSARHLTLAAAACVSAGSLAACVAEASKVSPDRREVPRAPGVYVQPPSVTVLPSSTIHFRAEVVGLSSTAVTWSVDSPPCGTLTPSGNLADFVAPSTVGSTCTVRARSLADGTKSGTGTVAVANVAADAPGGGGTAYHVGPGHEYASVGAVPWGTLGPGDTVYIYYRPTPYAEKIAITTSGTATQWIRVHGVPDPTTGALPIISGTNATTSANMNWRTAWADPALIQDHALIHVIAGNGSNSNPDYVEIAYLDVRDAVPGQTFTAQNGAAGTYIDFTACVYVKSPQHFILRDSVLHNCGQGFYVWTGTGASSAYYEELARDVVLRRNYIYDNTNAGSWYDHQVYTEADGVIIEGNRFGPNRPGGEGNHIKDRSAGTVIRYNFFEEAPSRSGYFLDLVEPQEGCPAIGYTSCGSSPPATPNAKYQQTFVYGNVFVRSNSNPNFVHWNEDHSDSPAKGRAAEANGRLFFYNNTIVDTSVSDLLFNETNGAYECPAYDLPGRVVFVNNLVYTTKGTYRIGEYCYGRPRGPGPDYTPNWTYRHGSWDFGPTWLSPGATFFGFDQTGFSGVTSPPGNDPGFTNRAGGDYTLAGGSGALTIGGALPAQVASNYLGLDLTPNQQYLFPHPTSPSPPTPRLVPRTPVAAGSAVGAFGP